MKELLQSAGLNPSLTGLGQGLKQNFIPLLECKRHEGPAFDHYRVPGTSLLLHKYL